MYIRNSKCNIEILLFSGIIITLIISMWINLQNTRNSRKLLEGVFNITQRVNNSISYDTMEKEWEKIRYEVILPKIIEHTNDPEAFVVDIHEYLRIKRNIGIMDRGWNLFNALLSKSGTDCACVCSTMFVALACSEAGFFVGSIQVGATADHMFILSKDEQIAFETVYRDRTNWILLKLECYALGLNCPLDRFILISSISELLSSYAVNAAVTLINNGMQIEAKKLLEDYPNKYNPNWWDVYISTLRRNEWNKPIVLDVLDGYLSALENKDSSGANLVASHAERMSKLLHNLRKWGPIYYDNELYRIAKKIVDNLSYIARYNRKVTPLYESAMQEYEQWHINL